MYSAPYERDDMNCSISPEYPLCLSLDAPQIQTKYLLRVVSQQYFIRLLLGDDFLWTNPVTSSAYAFLFVLYAMSSILLSITLGLQTCGRTACWEGSRDFFQWIMLHVVLDRQKKSKNILEKEFFSILCPSIFFGFSVKKFEKQPFWEVDFFK